MKKQLLISVIALLAVCGANAQTTTTMWNVSDFENGEFTETRVFDGLTVVAIDGASVTIEGNSKKIDDFSFTKRLKTGGGGFEDGASDVLPTKRYLSFPVSGNAKITVYAMSSSSSQERQMIVSNGTQIINEPTVGGASLEKHEINYEGEATTIYLYSRASGLNFYAVSREQAGTGIPTVESNKAVKSVDYFNVVGQPVAAQAKGLVIAKTTYEDGTVATKKVYRLDK
ncbi:MAG: hypothetical protein LBH61_03810 [Dysgonamonadaceae bacterium]|jgi:hypothetical protein|nr:hypothetical protein [Dysgonamonadaceae bacterium]